MELKKKDFIEIEFTGKIKDGEIFDSNIKEDIEKAKLEVKPKPLIFCLGEGMFLKSIDEFLVGKTDEKKSYEIDLTPQQAFGLRDSKQVQVMPMKIFAEQKANPFPGAMFNFDGKIAKVLSVSGGRVMVDFNNPLAGKDVHYKINVLRKVTDLNEKITAFIDFLFRKELKFEVKEKKLIIKADAQMSQFVGLFTEKFKDIFDLNLEVELEGKPLEKVSKTDEKEEVKDEPKKEEVKEDEKKEEKKPEEKKE